MTLVRSPSSLHHLGSRNGNIPKPHESQVHSEYEVHGRRQGAVQLRDLPQQRLCFCPAALQGLALQRLGAALLSGARPVHQGSQGCLERASTESPEGQTWGRGSEGFLEERTQKGHLCPIGIGQVRNRAQELSSWAGDDPGNVQPNLPAPGRSWRGQVEGGLRKCLALASMQEESILRARHPFGDLEQSFPGGTHVPPYRPLHPSGHGEPQVPRLLPAPLRSAGRGTSLFLPGTEVFSPCRRNGRCWSGSSPPP